MRPRLDDRGLIELTKEDSRIVYVTEILLLAIFVVPAGIWEYIAQRTEVLCQGGHEDGRARDERAAVVIRPTEDGGQVVIGEVGLPSRG